MKKYATSFFIYFLIFGILVQFASTAVHYLFDYIEVKENVVSRYNIEKKEKEKFLQEFLKNPQHSIDAIVQNQIFISYINGFGNQKVVEDLFLYTLNANENYLQVRYIDKNGNEKIKASRSFTDKKSLLIDKSMLQNKKNRYYFKESIAQNADKFWYSKIDLNMERGKIEIPYRPTLRVAKAVMKDAHKQGIIVINMLLDGCLKSLINSHYFNISLVDGLGNYIYSYDNSKSWSIDLNTKYNFIQDKNLNIQKMKNINNDNFFAYSAQDVLKSNQNIFFVFDAKDKIIKNILLQNIEVSFIVLLIVLIITIFLAFIISKIPSRLHRELKDALKVIDRYVLMLTINKKGFIETVSEALSSRIVFNKDDTIGKKYTDFLSDLDMTLKDENGKLKIHGFFKKNLKCLNKDGKYIWLYQDVMPLLDNKKTMHGYACFFTDITDKKEIERKAVTDPLTNVSNRVKLNEILEREVELSVRYDKCFSIVLIDIDFFKHVNDDYGHQVGDGVLVEFADILVKHTRKVDIVGRYGGEEFLIILSETSQKGAIKLAEKIRACVEKYLFLGKYKITASFGVATYDKDTANCVEAIIKNADTALYKAKKDGRNKVEFL